MKTKLETRNLSVIYGDRPALHGINLSIPEKQVTALIGPSGCGKSTFLRCFNRMNDIVENARIEGEILIDGADVYRSKINVADLRQKVGMVFQKYNPFPKTIFDNVAFGPRIHGTKDMKKLTEIVESSLRRAGLWDEVKDRMKLSALGLSGGQQQRLCIARALAVKPEVLLMDEPASALDPRSTLRVEELIQELKADLTIVIVTHNMQQATRVSQYTAFFYEGNLIEFGPTSSLFSKPKQEQTQQYIQGRFG